MARVLVAARLSQLRKDDGKGRQTGIESQDKLTVAELERQGHTVVAVVADTKSGTVQPWNRPNLKPWVTDPTKMAQYDAIAGYRFDRLSRGDNQSTNEIEKWAHDNHKQLLTEDGLVFPCEGADGIRWDLQKRLAHEEWLKISERYRRMQTHLRDSNKLTGRPTYGLMRIDSGDHKTLAPHPAESLVIKEAAKRYLGGETIDALCEDFNSRGIASPTFKGKPGKHWHAKTLAGLLRNPAMAGRRMDAAGKTILRFAGIITWDEHTRLVGRLDSRAHRKGISPSNTALLVSLLKCSCGRPMNRITIGGVNNRYPAYYCRSGKDGCKMVIHVDDADRQAREDLSAKLGHGKHRVPVPVAVANHQDEIEQLRQDRNGLDDLADDYDDRHAALTAQIRDLADEDRKAKVNGPSIEMVSMETEETIAEHLRSLDTAGIRQAIVGYDIGFIATKDDSGKVTVALDPTREGYKEMRRNLRMKD